MNPFSNLFVDGIDFIQIFSFTNILICLSAYFLLFWLAVTLWVYFDALRRYDNKKTAFFLALAVFILVLPALIFYFAIRPHIDDTDEMLEYANGGVNVPLVNFVGEKGVQMTLELNIHQNPIQLPHDMKVDVSWNSIKDEMRVSPVFDNIRPRIENAPKKNNIFIELASKIRKVIDSKKNQPVIVKPQEFVAQNSNIGTQTQIQTQTQPIEGEQSQDDRPRRMHFFEGNRRNKKKRRR